ncbi:ribonuclease III [Pseudohaliea rubra]|uniref:Ribonuclease 3 n=1 Tax=Pseudohaliea rubra DSM 19751 TaxID=1265313 RepID=A0A095XZQ6_9GAMM|nr:ribonuclease III [Pseudohaliea rubra]KGE05256.1 Ribonuclease III [Pseudohaliea rubra DSM 19751]
MQLDRLESAIAYHFEDRELLVRALSHRSVGRQNNERLEFLGDSALNHCVAERLFHRFPDADEGELSRMRAALVRGDTLATVARQLGLGDHLRLGPGERKSGGRRRASILADALEAVLGAVLIDGGLAACGALVERLLEEQLGALEGAGVSKDPKTRLQEHLQGRGLPLPSYELVSVEGSEHAREFEVACRVAAPACEARGSGSSRRRAEQAAARAVLESLDHG